MIFINSTTSMEIQCMSKADNIINQQKDLQRQLEDLQRSCKHTSEAIRQLPDKNEWWWQCMACSKNTRLANQQDIYKYLNN